MRTLVAWVWLVAELAIGVACIVVCADIVHNTVKDFGNWFSDQSRSRSKNAA